MGLEGDWRIDRKIKSFGSFSGSAAFTKKGQSSYLYQESGMLTRETDRYQMQAFQEYIYKLGENRDSLSIYFVTDLRLFLELIFEPSSNSETVIAKGHHLCINDHYHACFEFSKNRFDITYDVQGPGKDYKIVSSFSKCTSQN